MPNAAPANALIASRAHSNAMHGAPLRLATDVALGKRRGIERAKATLSVRGQWTQMTCDCAAVLGAATNPFGPTACTAAVPLVVPCGTEGVGISGQDASPFRAGQAVENLARSGERGHL